MTRRLLAAAAALGATSLATAASAQIVPFPALGQYTPYNTPYTPPPGAQPIPYTSPYAQPSAPGYSNWSSGGSNDERDFLSDRTHNWPIVRISGGAGADFFAREKPHLGFDLDVTLGFRWALHRRVSLDIEAAYSFASEPTFGGHFGAIGAGPEVYIARHLSVGWSPKFVIGATWSGLALGVRNMLDVGVMMNVFHIEVGHEWLRTSDALHRDQHEVRAQLGVDLAALARFYAWAIVGGK